MGLEELKSKILEDAEKEAEEILREAEEEAEKILAKAEEEAERIRREILERAEREAEVRARRIIAQARLEVKQKEAQVKERYIQMAVERAKEKIEEMRGSKEYLEFLYENALTAVRAIDADEVVVRAPEEDVTYLEELLPDIRTETEKDVELGDPIDATAGVVAESADGKEAFDNTVDARLERMRPRIVKEVSEILFGG